MTKISAGPAGSLWLALMNAGTVPLVSRSTVSTRSALMVSWNARRTCWTSISLPASTRFFSPVVIPSPNSTTTRFPSIVVRALVGPLPVCREKRPTTAPETAALSCPDERCPRAGGPLEGVGMASPDSRSPQRPNRARGGGDREEPNDDPHSLPRQRPESDPAGHQGAPAAAGARLSRLGVAASGLRPLRSSRLWSLGWWRGRCRCLSGVVDVSWALSLCAARSVNDLLTWPHGVGFDWPDLRAIVTRRLALLASADPGAEQWMQSGAVRGDRA